MRCRRRASTFARGRQHDADYERLLEVFSGHGNSEEYREPAATPRDGDGALRCPAPTRDFLPCCWRAGELVRERCGELPAAECEARVVEARRLALEAGANPERVLPDTQPEDWLDCDQCRDCFKPACAQRPRSRRSTGSRSATSRRATASRSLPLRLRRVVATITRRAPGTGYKQ